MTNGTVFTEGSLTISRTFRTSRERLYACWTESAHLAAWTGPNGFTSEAEVFEPRPGGRHLAKVTAPDGKWTRIGGVYKVTDPAERLVFTHAWLDEHGKPQSPVTTVAVTLAATERGTLMVFHQAGFGSDAARDGHEAGWNASFDRLELYLTRSPKREN